MRDEFSESRFELDPTGLHLLPVNGNPALKLLSAPCECPFEIKDFQSLEKLVKSEDLLIYDIEEDGRLLLAWVTPESYSFSWRLAVDKDRDLLHIAFA